MSAIEQLKFHHEIHIYERSVTNHTIYRCTHPDCKHYQKREYLIGKRAECPKCHEFFIISKSDLKAGQAKAGKRVLTCFLCGKSPKAKVQRQLTNQLESIFDDMDKEEDNQKNLFNFPPESENSNGTETQDSKRN